MLMLTLIKGAEFEVLKQVPWEKVNVEVLLVELEHAGKVQHDHCIDDHKNSQYPVIINHHSILYLAPYLPSKVFPGSRRDVHLFLDENG